MDVIHTMQGVLIKHETEIVELRKLYKKDHCKPDAKDEGVEAGKTDTLGEKGLGLSVID